MPANIFSPLFAPAAEKVRRNPQERRSKNECETPGPIQDSMSRPLRTYPRIFLIFSVRGRRALNFRTRRSFTFALRTLADGAATRQFFAVEFERNFS